MDNKKMTIVSRAAAVLTMTIWGLAFIFSKMALAAADPVTLLAWRFTIAFLVLNLIKMVGRIRFRMKGKPVGKLLLLGLIQPIIYFLCENYGVKYSSATFSGIMIALMPIVLLFAAGVFLKDSVTAAQVLFSLLSVAGVIVMSVNPGQGQLATVRGAVFMTGAVIAGAAFILLSRNLAEQFTPFERTYFMFTEGFLFFAVVSIIMTRGNLKEMVSVLKVPSFLTAVLYLGVLASVGAFFLQNFYVSYLSVAEGAVFANLSTVVTILAGILILQEPFSGKTIPCTIMIIAGVVGVQLAKKRTA